MQEARRPADIFGVSPGRGGDNYRSGASTGLEPRQTGDLAPTPTKRIHANIIISYTWDSGPQTCNRISEYVDVPHLVNIYSPYGICCIRCTLHTRSSYQYYTRYNHNDKQFVQVLQPALNSGLAQAIQISCTKTKQRQIMI